MVRVSWKNFEFLYPLCILLELFFTVSEENHLDFLQKLSFDKNLAEKPKSSDFETISTFCSSLLVELISTLQIFKFHWICSLE